jgi:hypothetical protein
LRWRDKAEVTGDRLREAVNINKSLSTLGQVVKDLSKQSAPGDRDPKDAKNGGKNAHVQYRNSVLTWLLKDSLGGNAKLLMLTTVSPSPMQARSATESPPPHNALIAHDTDCAHAVRRDALNDPVCGDLAQDRTAGQG